MATDANLIETGELEIIGPGSIVGLDDVVNGCQNYTVSVQILS